MMDPQPGRPRSLVRGLRVEAPRLHPRGLVGDGERRPATEDHEDGRAHGGRLRGRGDRWRGCRERGALRDVSSPTEVLKLFMLMVALGSLRLADI